MNFLTRDAFQEEMFGKTEKLRWERKWKRKKKTESKRNSVTFDFDSRFVMHFGHTGLRRVWGQKRRKRKWKSKKEEKKTDKQNLSEIQWWLMVCEAHQFQMCRKRKIGRKKNRKQNYGKKEKKKKVKRRKETTKNSLRYYWTLCLAARHAFSCKSLHIGKGREKNVQ